MEVIRDKYADKVQISPILLVNHSTRDVTSFLEPLELFKEILQTRTKLDLEESSVNTELKFMRWTNDTVMHSFLAFDVMNFNIDAAEWKQKLKEQQIKHEAALHEDARKTHERRRTKFLHRKNNKRNETTSITKTQSDLFDPEACQETSVPEPSSSQYDSTLTLKLPHFYYWTHLFYSYWTLAGADLPLYEEISGNFPKSFTWLLGHCAKMIEVTPNELYSQLLIVENQFLYALKPMSKVKTRVKYRPKKQLPKKMVKIVNQFKNVW